MDAMLNNLLRRLHSESKNSIGYPVSRDFDYSALAPFLEVAINNIGDPFLEGTYHLETHAMEREVLDFYARVFRAEPNQYWGYVTNGGSESNLYGLYLARELYPKGMVYYSESTHYSVQKNIHLLNMPSIAIRSQENGEIDYDDLYQTILLNRQQPVIMLINVGTTMTEAIDDLNRIREILRKLAIHHFYIHVDGALAGAYAAWLDPKPTFDFADGVDSIAISGHKFIGSPFPCGVVLTKKQHRDRIARSISYINNLDTTISGSRNGHAPLFLWYTLSQLGEAGMQQRLKHSQRMATYLLTQLRLMGIQAWKNEGAITVVFPAPSNIIRDKWQLATDNGQSHVICMPHVSYKQLDAFLADMKAVPVTKSQEVAVSV
ncbi:MAG: histidine decarboxylase [Lewinellaceae bacterium]|nr:histidine decarboxylase [Lewinellaceae bacterium]HPR00636.1 histidine decarboxylase [Saprospiraceae bacterium]